MFYLIMMRFLLVEKRGSFLGVLGLPGGIPFCLLLPGKPRILRSWVAQFTACVSANRGSSAVFLLCEECSHRLTGT